MDTKLSKQIKAGMAQQGLTAAKLAGALVNAGAPTSWRSVEAWVQGTRAPRPEAMEALVRIGILPAPEQASAAEEAQT
jgi:hypothetical protein